MELQSTRDDNFKVTVKWKDVTIEMPITEEQLTTIVQKAIALANCERSTKKLSLMDSAEFLLEEEAHQRKILLQLHQNRRVLEEQRAFMGVGDASLRIINELAEINRQIREVSAKIDEISGKLRSASL